MHLYPLTGIPQIQAGDDLSAFIHQGLVESGLDLRDGDVLVVAQKIISKAEDRMVPLNSVKPSPRAQDLAAQVHKDPRLVELILQESQTVLRTRPGVIIVEHRLGYVHANAGIDQSNIEGDDHALLLPLDPDDSARRLSAALGARTGHQPPVIINDSAGRAWRNGIIGFAIGLCGFEPVVSLVGSKDLNGRVMRVTEIAVADELAAAASHVMGQGAEGFPVVLIRGAQIKRGDYGMRALLRDAAQDLFR